MEDKRTALYDRVCSRLRVVADNAVPGEITLESFAKASVDVVLEELLKVGAVSPDYAST